jgi:hypothetical protein
MDVKKKERIKRKYRVESKKSIRSYQQQTDPLKVLEGWIFIAAVFIDSLRPKDSHTPFECKYSYEAK